MSIFESIKSEKRLSFSHWRYRILHWFWNVSPNTPEEAVAAGMNRFFYTHYCPLFHMTNLLLLALPFILFVKLVAKGMKYIGKGLAFVVRHIPEAKARIRTDEDKRALDIQRMVSLLNDEDFQEEDLEFEFCWKHFFGGRMLILTREEAEPIFEKYKVVVAKKKAERAAKIEARRKRTIFWVNFSRVFIKGFFNVFYIGLIVASLWLVFRYGLGVLQWFTSVPFGDIFHTMLMITVYGLIGIVVVGTLLWAFGQKLLLIIGHVLVAAIDWLCATFESVKDFVSVFYEENCPAIEIISADDAIVEKEIQ